MRNFYELKSMILVINKTLKEISTVQYRMNDFLVLKKMTNDVGAQEKDFGAEESDVGAEENENIVFRCATSSRIHFV